MAWTAPATYSVNEIVTASKLNTHIRDNMLYLKGQAGPVTIEDVLTISQTGGFHQIEMAKVGESALGYIAHAGAITYMWSNRNPTTGVFADTSKSTAGIQLVGSASASVIQFLTAAAANTAGSVRAVIDGSGNLGVGITTALGRLHTYDTDTGVLTWRNAAVSGTIVPVLAAGAVVASLAGFYVVYDGSNRSSGALTAIAATGTLAFTQNIHVGTGTYVLHLNANGSVDVQRTSGTGTAKISLFLLYQ